MAGDGTGRRVRVPLVILRCEGAALFVAATAAFAHLQASWWLYGLLFFVPDVSFVAYKAGPRIGAYAYNALHTTVVPLVLGLVAWRMDHAVSLAVAATWLAHIGFDRTFGYGLKDETSFHETHLGSLRSRPGAGGKAS